MFDENNAKQIILRILQIPIPDQVSDESLKFVISFFQNKRKVISSKTGKLLESISPFSNFMQKIFGDDVRQGNYSFPWSYLTIIDLKLKPRILSENDIKAASLFTFYAALDWLTAFELNNITNDTDLNHKKQPLLPDTSLLDSILTVSSMYKPFIHISLSLFCLIFNRITSIEPTASVKALEGSACKFLSSVTSTDSQTLHLVQWVSLINQEYEKTYSESEQLIMPQPLRTVLELVMQAIQILPKYFNNEDAHTIFSILKPFLLKSCIDPFMLNLAFLLSPFLDTEETDQIFQSGVSELMSHIISIQPFLNFSGLRIHFNCQKDKKEEIKNEKINQLQNENEQEQNEHKEKTQNDNENEEKIENEEKNQNENEEKNQNKDEEKNQNKDEEKNQNENEEKNQNKDEEKNQNEDEEKNQNKDEEKNQNENDEKNQNKDEEKNQNENDKILKQDKNEQKNASEIKRYDDAKINSNHFFIERGNASEVHYFINQEDFSSSQDLIEKIPDDIKSVSCLLKQILEYSSHMNCELFPSLIESKYESEPKSDSLWSVLIVLLYLCDNSKFEEQSLCEFFNYLISNTSLFQSNYTIFQPQDNVLDDERCNLDLFLKLRFYAIRIFISPSQISCFQLYWKNISSKVFMNKFSNKDECAKFAEFFSFMETINFSSLIFSVVPICISDTYFATLNVKDSLIVNSAVYNLINSLFKQEIKSKEPLIDFFMNESFMNFISAAIFDSFFNDLALRILFHFFLKFNEKVAPRICDAFKATQNDVDATFCIENQEEMSHHLSVLCKLIEVVIDLILHHSEKALLFSQLFQSSYRSLKNLSSMCTDCTQMKKEIGNELHFSLCQLLHSFIKFAALVSFDENDDLSWTSRRISSTQNSAQLQSAVRMTQTFLDEILTMIQSIEGPEPSTPCFSALIFAVSSGKSASLRAEFLISRPSFLALTIRAFSSSSRLSGLIRFVGSLCDFSNANCRACHVGGLDTELVKILHSNALSTIVVKDAFRLIEKISQAASSTASVSSYMTCFHCIQEPYKLSPLTEPALLSLDKILARGSQTPAAFLPVMNELPCIRVEDLTESDLYNGFTIVAWIFIDGGSQDSPASLISIGRDESQQNKGSLLTVIVQLGRVFISNGRFLGGKDAIVLDESVPTDRWTMIAVTFENDKIGQRNKTAEFRIKSFISNKTNTASQRIPIEIGQSRNRPLTLTSCGTVEGGSSLEHPVLLASITLFPALKPHECLEIAQNGLLLTRSNTEGSSVSLEAAKKLPAPFFCSVLESENSVLRVRSTMVKKPKTSKVSLVGRQVVQHMPFADVFTRFFTAKSLLPIFAILSLPSSDNSVIERNKSISSLTVSVLFRTLQMSPAASRNDFVASGGFRIVSFLLSRVPECLTSDLFIQFAALARESSSEEVKTSTADEIVFNERLWCLADEKTQLFVVQQWINLAYEDQKGNKNSLKPARTFSSYLSSTIYLFWSTNKKNNFSSDLRTLVMNSIIIRSGTNLSTEDVNAMISASYSSDQKVCLDVLYIMKQVALMPYSFSSFSDADFLSMNHLFSRGSFAVICALVRLIIAIHSSRVECRFTLGEHLTMAANEISFSDNHFNDEDASQIADLADSHPETYPVCCAAIAATTNNQQKSLDTGKQTQSLEAVFSSVMRTQRNMEEIKDLAFWPIYSSICCGGQVISSAAKFALKNVADLTELFSQVVVASVTAGDKSGSACREVLLHAGIELLPNRIDGKKQDQNVQPKLSEDTYVGLCFFFIFYYGSNSSLSKYLENESLESGIINESEIPRTSKGLKKSPFKLFIGNNSEKVGFNIDAKSNWRDKELALQCVQVIVKRKIAKYANLALFLLFYLLKTLPEPSTTLLQEVKTIFEFNEPFLSLLIFLIKKKAQTCPPDRTVAFEILVDQFFTQSSFIQSSINNCSLRFNRLLRRFKDEERKRPIPPPFSSESVEFELKEEQRSSKHLWRSLWRQMTFDCAPWNGSLSNTPAPRRWKRDETLCTSSFVPMKMKVNYKFNDHGEASLGRELGNLKLAREQNEETKRKRRQASLCPELLETGSFDDEDEDKNKKKKDENIIIDINDESQSQSRSKSKSSKKSDYSINNNNNHNLSHGLGFDTATRFFRSESSLVPIFCSSCQRVRVSRKRDCVFNLFSDFIGLKFKSKLVTIPIHDITRVFLRDPLHHPCGIEIFTRQGISYFLVFPEEIKNTEVAIAISRQNSSPHLNSFIQTVKSADFLASHGITQLWCQRKISNFEYLMNLNHFSGRSFSQLSMYPFFPWVLDDYESEVLDLKNSSSFRDLSMPIGKLGQKRLESLRKRAKEMQEFGNDPFLYSSYTVSPLIVILWMMRVEPFTTLHIDMQSGKFDHASRQFSSIPDTFRMVKTHLNDFRELIPEFYFSKSFLVNENKFDLGFANENKIDDVLLPPWASKNALSFIYLNRKALESDHVSRHLNEWIDLIWGFKQRGKEAEEADNTYDPSIYSDVWTEEALNDQDKKNLVEETMTHCGQIPDQLFTSPHPIRQERNNRINKNLRCLTLDQPLQIENDSILFGTSKELRDSSPGSQKFELVILRSSGKLINVVVSCSNGGKDLSLVSSHDLMKGFIVDVEEATSFAMFSLDEIAFGTSSGKVSIIDAKQSLICSFQPHSGIVNCVAASSPFVVSGGADTVIACSEKVGIDKIKRIHSMPAYSSEVVSTAISREFHMIVSGTRGGLVIVQSLEESAVTCVIELKEGRKPIHISITRSWGFVVVFTQKEAAIPINEILVFTLCGEMVGSTMIGARVSKVLTWSSEDGFDFVAAALVDGKIIAFEAFFVNDGFVVVADSSEEKSGLDKGFGCEGDEVVLMSFSIDSGTFLAVTKNGRISIICEFYIRTDQIMKFIK